MSNIHRTAIVEDGANIADDVQIGPYSIIGPDVSIGAGTKIGPHVVVDGHTTIGSGNTIHQFASIGGANQDKKYAGEPTKTIIGDNNTIHECVTIHRGTTQDEGITEIGNGNLFMAYSHAGHDCRLGNNCVFANSATLAGHVTVGDFVIVGGLSGVHQFCKIGSYSMLGGMTGAKQDIPAFIMATGNPAEPRGMNFEGMRRRGFSKEAVSALKNCYKVLYLRSLKLEDALAEMEPLAQAHQEVALFVNSIKASDRGIIR